MSRPFSREFLNLTTPRSRIIINCYSRLWEPILNVAQCLGLATPILYQNWLTVEDITNLLSLADCEVIKRFQEVLLPLPVPLVADLSNRFLVKVWPFKHFALTNFIVARPRPQQELKPALVSAIVPARNEAGNISEIVARIPEMGEGTEILFVEGHSRDNSYATIETAIAAHPERRCHLLRQDGVGKADAVRLGFAQARGEVLMILDAGLTVLPEDLPRFYNALQSGNGEFINGVRLVYPMETQAMRFVNCWETNFSALLSRGCWVNRSKTPSAGQKFCGKGTTKRSMPTSLTLRILILLATSI